jgi:hypothetical protein
MADLFETRYSMNKKIFKENDYIKIVIENLTDYKIQIYDWYYLIIINFESDSNKTLVMMAGLSAKSFANSSNVVLANLEKIIPHYKQLILLCPNWNYVKPIQIEWCKNGTRLFSNSDGIRKEGQIESKTF